MGRWSELDRMRNPLNFLLELVHDGGSTYQAKAGAITLFETRELLSGSAYLLALLVLVGAFLLGRDGPAGQGRLAGLLGRLRARLLVRPRTGLILLALGGGLFSAWMQVEWLGGWPHVHDEIAYRFQAEILARGAFWAPAPPVSWRPGLVFEFCPVHQGRWFGYSFPGFPVVLALGVLTGTASLVNPILNALALVLCFAALRLHLGRRAAMQAAAVMGLSPFFLFMGASQMSHPLMLLVVSAGLLAHARCRRQPASRGSFAALSLLVALGGNVRPLTAAALLGPLWLDIARARWRDRRHGELALAGLLAASGLLSLLAYNRAVTGDAFLSPMFVAFPEFGLGFRRVFVDGAWTQHGPAAAFFNLVLNLHSLDVQLLGLPVLGLLLPLLGIRWAWRRLPGAWFAGGFLLVVAQAGWFHPGTCYGPRYYYGLLPLLSVLVVGGVRTLADRSRSRWPLHEPALLLFLWIGAGVSTFPLRLQQLPHYWGVYPQAVDFLPRRGVRGRVVVIPPVLHHTLFLANGPFLEGENLYWNTRPLPEPPADLLRARGGMPPVAFPVRDFLGPELSRRLLPPTSPVEDRGGGAEAPPARPSL